MIKLATTRKPIIVISWVRDRKWLIYPKPVNQLLSTAELEAEIVVTWVRDRK
jgi:hypothetical protein